MAELGIIASALQIADVGFRLSTKLFKFAETVTSADRVIASISRDVKLTSSVLKDLGASIENDRQSRLINEIALQTADGVIKECLAVFNEMDSIFLKRTPLLKENQDSKATRTKKMLERLWWPYIQSKVLFLQSNLEKLKSTLLLMFHVIIYGRMTFEKSEPPSVIARQKTLIQRLNNSNQKLVLRFEHLKRETQAKVDRAIELEFPSPQQSSESQATAILDADTDTIAGPSSEPAANVYPALAEESLDTSTAVLTMEEKSDADNLVSDNRNTSRDGPKPVSPMYSQQAVLSDAAAHPLIPTTDSPDRPLSIDEVSAKLGTSSPVEIQSNAHPHETLHVKYLEYLKYLSVMAEDLINNVNDIADIMSYSGLYLLGRTFKNASDTATKRLFTDYVDVTINKTEQIHALINDRQGSSSGASSKNDPTHGHDVLSSLISRAIAGLQGKFIETEGEESESAASEEVFIRSRPSNERIESVVETKEPSQATATRQPMSDTSEVHELNKSGWRLPIQPRSSARLSQRIKRLLAGTEFYVHRILSQGRATRYSVGIEFPNIRELLSGSDKSVDISATDESEHPTHGIHDDRTFSLKGLRARWDRHLRRTEAPKFEGQYGVRALHAKIDWLTSRMYPHERQLENYPVHLYDDEMSVEDQRHRIGQTEDERKREDTEFQKRKRETLEKAGYSENSMREKLDERGKSRGKKIMDLTRPTYIKVHRKHLSPDTLDLYDLPWEWYDRDSDYIIIKRWIPQEEQDILFEHTKHLREGRLETHAAPVLEVKKRNDNLLLVRKKTPTRQRSRARAYPLDDNLPQWENLQASARRHSSVDDDGALLMGASSHNSSIESVRILKIDGEREEDKVDKHKLYKDTNETLEPAKRILTGIYEDRLGEDPAILDDDEDEATVEDLLALWITLPEGPHVHGAR